MISMVLMDHADKVIKKNRSGKDFEKQVACWHEDD
jgi:hypothetical protein